MVKSLLPLLNALNISLAPKSDEPKKLGRPKKVKPPSPQVNWRHGFSAENWLADKLYTYIHDQEKNELRVYMHAAGQYPKKEIGVWRIKKLIMPTLRQAITYQLTQNN